MNRERVRAGRAKLLTRSCPNLERPEVFKQLGVKSFFVRHLYLKEGAHFLSSRHL